MHKPTAALLVIASAISIVAIAQQPANYPIPVFRALAGTWSCVGGFPDGRQLAADLTFSAAQDGRLLRFSHVDREPSAYWQEATWLLDAKANRVLSLSVSGSRKNATTSAALFVANSWTDKQLVLEADSLKGPAWTRNRFSYSLSDSARMQMRWELHRGGTWILGDSLMCSR